jgi:hypothetical protein
MSVVVEFSSGLGNQLFQFAAGHNLACRRNTSLVGDPWSYSVPYAGRGPIAFRPFVLQSLGFPMEIRPSPRPTMLQIRGGPRLRRSLINFGRTRYKCGGEYSPEFEQLPANALLSGYFQDQRYFSDTAEVVTALIRERLETACDGQWQPLPESHGAIHMRRGDYLAHPDLLPEWFERYSRTVARLMLDEFGCDSIMVFTDDPSGARNVFSNLGSAVCVAEPSSVGGGAPDLLRMASARVLGIANSTFSWWAGVLGSAKGSTVVAPYRWSTHCLDPAPRFYAPEWRICDAR